MARREVISDEKVRAEIERLKKSPYVKLARDARSSRERKYLYQLRGLEKKGREIAEAEAQKRTTP